MHMPQAAGIAFDFSFNGKGDGKNSRMTKKGRHWLAAVQATDFNSLSLSDGNEASETFRL